MENSLPTHEVRAIGRKLVGDGGSASAELFAISLTAASFQAEGTVECNQQKLKMSCKAGRSAGHLLNTA